MIFLAGSIGRPFTYKFQGSCFSTDLWSFPLIIATLPEHIKQSHRNNDVSGLALRRNRS